MSAGAARTTTTGFLAMCRRESLRVLKIWTQTIAFPTVTAMLYLGVFGVALGERIGVVEGFEYLAWVLPGVVLLQCATQAYNNNSASMFQSRMDGYVEDVLSAPVHAWQVSLALMWGGILRAGAVSTLVLLLGGALAGTWPEHPVLLAVTMLSVMVLWGSVGVVAGTWAEHWDQHMMVGNLVLVPLAFVGGVFYSLSMLPDRLQAVVVADPLFYQVQAMRHAVLGTADTDPLLAVGTTVALAAVAFAVQTALFVRGWRLRE